MTDHSTVRGFSVGGVISRGFSIYFGNIVSFIILSVIAYIPVWIGLALIGGAAATPAAGPTGMPNFTGGYFVLLLPGIFSGYWLQAALIYGAISTLRGNKAGIGEMLSRSLQSLMLVIPVAIALTILIGIGFFLLIVPGIILLLMFWVVIPVAVVERPGFGGSFGRSRELTRGHRWSLFGLLILIAIIFGVLGFVFMAIGGAVGGGAHGWIQQIGGVISGGLMATIVAVSYHDLRVSKEGVGTAEIARVFD